MQRRLAFFLEQEHVVTEFGEVIRGARSYGACSVDFNPRLGRFRLPRALQGSY